MESYYSVAEHCCLVHDLVAAERLGGKWAAAALLHDGHEAYLGDVVTPLKALLGPAYAQLAARMAPRSGPRPGSTRRCSATASSRAPTPGRWSSRRVR